MADQKITALSANTTPLTTDILPMVDDPGGTPATQKITIASLLQASTFPAGAFVQGAYTIDGAVATGTTVQFRDDTIPQSNEGVQFMTVSITPKSATNILVIEATAHIANDAVGVGDIIGALFQDSTANALAVDMATLPAASYVCTLKPKWVMVSGTTSSTTFKFRAGAVSAGTTTFNGQAGARKFAGTYTSSITVFEYNA